MQKYHCESWLVEDNECFYFVEGLTNLFIWSGGDKLVSVNFLVGDVCDLVYGGAVAFANDFVDSKVLEEGLVGYSAHLGIDYNKLFWVDS